MVVTSVVVHSQLAQHYILAQVCTLKTMDRCGEVEAVAVVETTVSV
jgi:hypothetical protein